MYYLKNEDFCNSEVGTSAMKRRSENMSPKKEDHREKEEEEKDNGKAALQHHCDIVEKDQEDPDD
jgi:hypothetical protein